MTVGCFAAGMASLKIYFARRLILFGYDHPGQCIIFVGHIYYRVRGIYPCWFWRLVVMAIDSPRGRILRLCELLSKLSFCIDPRWHARRSSNE